MYENHILLGACVPNYYNNRRDMMENMETVTYVGDVMQ